MYTDLEIATLLAHDDREEVKSGPNVLVIWTQHINEDPQGSTADDQRGGSAYYIRSLD